MRIDHSAWLIIHISYVCIQAIWKRLYRTSSARDRGTLYHLRNAINRRNVIAKPKDAMDACKEFFGTDT